MKLSKFELSKLRDLNDYDVMLWEFCVPYEDEVKNLSESEYLDYKNEYLKEAKKCLMTWIERGWLEFSVSIGKGPLLDSKEALRSIKSFELKSTKTPQAVIGVSLKRKAYEDTGLEFLSNL